MCSWENLSSILLIFHLDPVIQQWQKSTYIIYVAAVPDKTILSHPPWMLSARQNLTTAKSKVRYESKSAVWCLLQHSIDHRGRRRVSIIWWMWLVMNECAVAYAAYMGFWIRSLVAAHFPLFPHLILHHTIPLLPLYHIWCIFVYIMPNKNDHSRFRPNPTRSVPPLVANVLLGAQGVSV